jgi:hypothetical protein
MQVRISAAFVITALAGSCSSSGSGVNSDKQINALSTSELASVCRELLMILPRKTFQCSFGPLTVGYMDTTSCQSELAKLSGKTACTATVGQMEGCAMGVSTASDADVCASHFPAECANVLVTACSGN